MRIAIPVAGETVASPLGDAEGFRFYEDDHGRIVRQFLVPMEERSTKAAIDLLERYGIDGIIAEGCESGGHIGELTQKLYDTLTGIQWGKLPDTKGWIVPVE